MKLSSKNWGTMRYGKGALNEARLIVKITLVDGVLRLRRL